MLISFLNEQSESLYNNSNLLLCKLYHRNKKNIFSYFDIYILNKN